MAVQVATNWVQIALATLSGDTVSRAALAKLCTDYREPLISFLISRGHDRHASEDMVQEFFLRLLESHAWRRADQARGRFRTFLLGALMHVIDHVREKADTAKRGGGIEHDGLDVLAEESFEQGAITRRSRL